MYHPSLYQYVQFDIKWPLSTISISHPQHHLVVYAFTTVNLQPLILNSDGIVANEEGWFLNIALHLYVSISPHNCCLNFQS